MSTRNICAAAGFGALAATIRNVSLGLALTLVLCAALNAQSNTPWPSAGNVGIGTLAPGTKLQVVVASSSIDGINVGDATGRFLLFAPSLSSNNYNPLVQSGDQGMIYSAGPLSSGGLVLAPWATSASGIRITGSGNIGIGMASPRTSLGQVLDVNGPVAFTNGANLGTTDFTTTDWANWGGGVVGWNKTNGFGEMALVSISGGGADGGFSFYDKNTQLVRILKNGNVGIGTTNPQNLLSVNGIVQAKEVLVNTGWSDYVFEPNYRLRPLKEVAAYVEANHHLPDIPSESEVKEKGISVGEMQSKLLAKIEELTLHMIELEHENGVLKESVRRLESGHAPSRGDRDHGVEKD